MIRFTIFGMVCFLDVITQKVLRIKITQMYKYVKNGFVFLTLTIGTKDMELKDGILTKIYFPLKIKFIHQKLVAYYLMN